MYGTCDIAVVIVLRSTQMANINLENSTFQKHFGRGVPRGSKTLCFSGVYSLWKLRLLKVKSNSPVTVLVKAGEGSLHTYIFIICIKPIKFNLRSKVNQQEVANHITLPVFKFFKVKS